MNNNIQHINATEEQFFKLWIQMLRPFLKIRQQEEDQLSKMLYYRYKILCSIDDKSLADSILFSEENRKNMREELKYEVYTFNNNLTILRKKKLIIGKTINLAIVPNVEKGFENFNFTYAISIKPRKNAS
jgi:hypothetical protein